MKIKAKVHAVTYAGTTYLVMAQTKQGAARDLLEHISGEIDSQVATGEQLYTAGQRGQSIINEDKYKNAVDPNQTGLPLTAAQETGDTPPGNYEPIETGGEAPPVYASTGVTNNGE